MPLKFHISLREKISQSTRGMKNYDKSATMQISEMFGILYHVDGRRIFSNKAIDYPDLWQSLISEMH